MWFLVAKKLLRLFVFAACFVANGLQRKKMKNLCSRATSKACCKQSPGKEEEEEEERTLSGRSKSKTEEPSLTALPEKG